MCFLVRCEVKSYAACDPITVLGFILISAKNLVYLDLKVEKDFYQCYTE